jgi:hypothetical protein
VNASIKEAADGLGKFVNDVGDTVQNTVNALSGANKPSANSTDTPSDSSTDNPSDNSTD